MKFNRRSFLGSSSLLLSSKLLEALTTPLSKWTGPLLLNAATPAPQANQPAVTFVDVAKEAGVTAPNVWGGVDSKKYILETKGSGLAFFDYDNDGWLDIYLTNGMRLGETYEPGKGP
ncbi:MAG: ASPIC/UnbV domain protein, partial [Acidobacteria bacterium]|nr:ASPIC/UnbV domain protein [Acidobacteriota bacterium]